MLRDEVATPLLEDPDVRRRRLGAYYTPPELTAALVTWAIRSATDQILEPSFGGCGFLAGSLERLRNLGSSEPIKQLFGCDVAPEAFTHLSSLAAHSYKPEQFLKGDFIRLERSSFPVDGFDVVVGNPPYVGHHRLTRAEKSAHIESLRSRGFKVDGKANLWACFILHSLSFVRPGGRMAWLLPGSFFHADYAATVRDALARRFQRVLAITLDDRVFTSLGAAERSVVVLCDGFKKGLTGRQIDKANAGTVLDLVSLSMRWDTGARLRVGLAGRSAHCHLLPGERHTYLLARTLASVKRLGDFAKISIGIVTGANRVFVMSAQEAAERKIGDKWLRRIVTTSKYLGGLVVTATDLEVNVRAGRRALLLATGRAKRLPSALQKYLDTACPPEVRSKVHTFSKRPVWHDPDDGIIPDAFFCGMSGAGPRMVLNEAEVNCTNSLYKVQFKEEVTATTKALLSISLSSTFGQISAELVGRGYGAGLLKHEPSDAAQIRIVVPSRVPAEDVGRKKVEVDSLLRAKRPDDARRLCDEFILQHVTASERQILTGLNEATLLRLRQGRYLTRSNTKSTETE